MILTGNQIEKEVGLGRIKIEPFFSKLINPNSYNYRIGPEILMITEDIIDPKKKSKTKKLLMDKKRGFLLKPRKIYLARTYEEIGSDNFTTILSGRSSVGRLGLFLQITADLGHLGAKHCWTLELKVVQPLIIYPYMKIGQVSFWENCGPKNKKYCGEYGTHSKPYSSILYKELDNF